MEQQILFQKVCYHSSPEYQNTFFGKYFYIYQSKGKVTLTNLYLRYRSKKFNFDIRIESILDMRIGRFKWYQKPIELDYLEITFMDEMGFRTVLLVPTESALMFVWNTNKIIKNWYKAIQYLRGSGIGYQGGIKVTQSHSNKKPDLQFNVYL